MLVYGDWNELADPVERLAALGSLINIIGGMPAGLERHARLVGALIDGGQLLQGVEDRLWPVPRLGDLVHSLALCLVRSVDTRFRDIGALPSVPSPALPSTVELRLPEGFAFYGVYPEAYIGAARRLKLAGMPRVIGIRSIGTTLGAVVAAAIGASPAITVRPFGDAFRRKVELPAEIIESEAHYIVVDEGPGLSGSSFGAVADWLEGHGVPLERIAFLPSHSADPGPHSSEAHRRRWRKAQRVAADADHAFLEERFGSLELLDSGGPWQRVKYLANQNGGRVLIKFSGLGAAGEKKRAMARALHAEQLVPEPLALVHGFLVEQWAENARALGPEDRPIEDFGCYIAARARLFAAPPHSGATIERLHAMCHRNIGLALGAEFARTLGRFDLADLEPRVRRVRTDNKMQPEEWLRAGDGRLLKADALDHHQAHDLIGCQAIEWDVAGLTEEFGLGPHEEARLTDASGIDIDLQLLAFYRVAYAAFRLGQSSLSGDGKSAERYGRSIRRLLHQYS